MGLVRPLLERNIIEDRIGLALENSDWTAATTHLLEGYGPEILAFLASVLRDGSADEAFSLFSEAVWVGVPKFSRRCSARTWAYSIARHSASQHRRSSRRRAARFRPFPDLPALAEVEAKVRTDTLPFLRTEARSKFAALRESLPKADQILLTLRIDRKLSWEELARVMHESGADLDGPALLREAARLRKRFQIAKTRLRNAAIESGLLSNTDS